MTTKLRATTVAVVALAAGLAPATAARADTTFSVTDTVDTPVGQGCPSQVDCSLREAVTSAGTTPGPDILNVVAGRYDLDNGALAVGEDLRIQRIGTGVAAIDGQRLSRVLSVTDATLTLRNVEVRNGLAADGNGGGAIRVEGSGGLALDGVRIVSNESRNSGGGAIAHRGSGPLTAVGTRFQDNLVSTTTPGLGLGGGALASFLAPVTITASTFSRNTVNATLLASGGALQAVAGATLQDVRLTGNEARAETGIGGGASFGTGPVDIARTTVDGNVASGDTARGGGIAVLGGASARIVNSTVHGNRAEGQDAVVGAVGGGLYVSGDAVLQAATVAANEATTPNGPTSVAGTAIATTGGGSVVHELSIVAGNLPTVASECAGAGTVDSLGFSVVGADGTCSVALASVATDDPRLGALAANGGPTPTALPAWSSPAIDRAACTWPTDQRGVARPQLTACDAGAVEAVPPAPPETTIVSGPPAETSRTSATFVLSATGSPDRLECRVDGGAWSTCTSPVALVGLAVGRHTLEARAVRDLPAQVEATPASYAWEVRAAPPAPVVLAPAEGAVLGTATFPVSGTATPGARVTVVVDGASDASATADASGNWTVTITVAEGRRRLAAYATDPDGLDGPESAPVTVSVDLTAPLPPQLDAVPPARTYARDATVAFSGEAGATFECTVDAGAFAPCTSPLSLTGLDAGPHTFAVRQRDAAGNVSPVSATATWTVLAGLPAPTLTSVPAAVSSTAAVAFAGQAGVRFECRVDGGAWADCTSPFAPSGLADGPHTIAVRQVDDGAGGATSPAAEASFTLDTAAPAAPAILAAPAATIEATSAEVAFAGEPGGTFLCSRDGGAWEPCASPVRLTELALRAHRLELRQVDAAGNAGAVATVAFAVVERRADPLPRPDPVDPRPDPVQPRPSPRPAPRRAAPRRAAIVAPAATTSRGGRLTVGCTLDRGPVRRCAIDVLAGGRRVGGGVARFRGATRRGAVELRLDARGRSAVARLGGARLTLRLRASTDAGRRLAARRTIRVLPQRALVVPADGLFASGSATLLPAGERFLRRVAADLGGARAVACVGHTDAVGSAEANRALGRARAATVCAVLRAARGGLRTSTESRGESRPRATNATAAGRALNRRVELAVRY